MATGPTYTSKLFSKYKQAFYAAATTLGVLAFTWGGCSIYNAGYNSGLNVNNKNIRNKPIVERLESFKDESGTFYMGIKRLDGVIEGARTNDGRVWRTYSGIKIEEEPSWDKKAKKYFDIQESSKDKPAEVFTPARYPAQQSCPTQAPPQSTSPQLHPQLPTLPESRITAPSNKPSVAYQETNPNIVSTVASYRITPSPSTEDDNSASNDRTDSANLVSNLEGKLTPVNFPQPSSRAKSLKVEFQPANSDEIALVPVRFPVSRLQ